MNNDINEPIWAMNTNDIAAGFLALLFLGFIPVIPMAYLGWYVGDEFIGTNFAKWGLGAIMAFIGYMIISLLGRYKGKLYSIGFVVVQYVTADVVTMNINNGKNTLLIFEIFKNIIEWGLSNT